LSQEPPSAGEYQLLKRIGRGAYGDVYRALAPGGIEVALKRIFRAMDDESSRRELKALEKIRELRHPFLLQTHRFQAFEDRLQIVMELADGSLEDRLKQCLAEGLSGIPVEELLRYFSEAAEALDYLHQQKMTHRDIKPQNLLHVKGHAKVADFGIARAQQDTLDHTLNAAGTPAYMAPEMWRGNISVHSDQYSFALTWYEMRTGRRALSATSQIALLQQHLTGMPDVSGVPPAEQRVLLRALAKEPNKRFPTCVALVQALGEATAPRAAPSARSWTEIQLPRFEFGLARLWRKWLSRRRQRDQVDPGPTLGGQFDRAPSLTGTAASGTRSGQPPEAPQQPPPPDVIKRHTDIAFPAKCPVSKECVLRIKLVPAEEILPSGEVRPVRHPHTHDATLTLKAARPEQPEQAVPPIRLTVSVAAENFAIAGNRFADLVVPREGKSPTLSFLLRGQKVGPGRIMIDFMQNGRPVGSVDLYPQVVRRSLIRAFTLAAWSMLLALAAAFGPAYAWAVAPLREPSQKATPSIFDSGASLWYSMASLSLLCAVGLVWVMRRSRQRARIEGAQFVAVSVQPLQPPDVVIKVFEHRFADKPGRLHFHLFSTHPKLQDLPVLDGDVGTQELRSEISEWVENQLRTLGSAARHSEATALEVDRALADVGSRLYEELLPEKMQQLCWTLRQRGVQTILILSDEPHIPWELIKPYRADSATGRIQEQDDFWGQAFALTHWLRGRPPVQHLALRRILALAVGCEEPTANPASPVRELAFVSADTLAPPAAPSSIRFAQEELAVLQALERSGARVEVLPARKRQLVDAFERGAFDLLHLACHGTFGGVVKADASAIQMEDGVFSAAELPPRLAGALRSAAPLIFFNACETGRLGFSLTRLGSWGARLVQLGCGAFVGALWPVTDKAALAFAQEFYEGLAQGFPLGKATLQARLRVRERHPNDPSWLAYSCFADPMARIGSAAM
jgi:serine/threonine protein kinase